MERGRFDRRVPALVGAHARGDARQCRQQPRRARAPRGVSHRAAAPDVARCTVPGGRSTTITQLVMSSSGRVARTFVASFLVLFLEVALIRWMPAYIRLLAYFSNFILLASFLGIGVGCLLAPARARLFGWFPALVAAVVGVVYFFRLEVGIQPSGSIYFTSGTSAAGRARREHDAPAAALRRRRGAVRDARPTDGPRDGRAAAAHGLPREPRRQPRRRRRVRRHVVARAVAVDLVRAGVRRGASAPAIAGSWTHRNSHGSPAWPSTCCCSPRRSCSCT